MIMNKKYIIGIIVDILFLIVFASLIVEEINNVSNIEIESKEVWITTDVIVMYNTDGNDSYFVRYDDHNKETGILYTNKNGNGLKIGDIVTVYRSIHKSDSTDSTHAWTLSKTAAERQDVISLGLSIFFTIISVIILCILIKKLKIKKS